MWLSDLLERWNWTLEGPSSSPTIYSEFVLGSPSFISSAMLANSQQSREETYKVPSSASVFEPH